MSEILGIIFGIGFCIVATIFIFCSLILCNNIEDFEEKDDKKIVS